MELTKCFHYSEIFSVQNTYSLDSIQIYSPLVSIVRQEVVDSVLYKLPCLQCEVFCLITYLVYSENYHVFHYDQSEWGI